jgi:hypothetical protein
MTILYITVALGLFYLVCDFGVSGPVKRYFERMYRGD